MTGRLNPCEPRVSAMELEEIARSRVERARIDILLEQPFLATALLSIPMRGTSEQSIRTALVADGRRIVYRHDLVAALDRPRVRRLIMHALMHAVLKHRERGVGRDWKTWTIACDIALDLLFRDLRLEPESGAAVLPQFAGMSAEKIYETLASPTSGPPLAPMPADDAILPPDASSSDPDERDAFERTMMGSDPPTAMQCEQLNQDLVTHLRRTVKQAPGRGAGTGSTEIDAAGNPHVPWTDVLARFMQASVDRDWSFARPNRKHLWRGLYLPGPLPIDGGRFVVAIDTSGSMSDADLARILREIDAIRKLCASDLTVLQFDAKIHAVAEFSRWSQEDGVIGSTEVMRVFGRGGTDIRLPFNWVERELENGREISALIVCTDGFGPLPDKAPRDLPVLFMLTPHHRAPKFGEHVLLGKKERERECWPVFSAYEAEAIQAMGF